MDEREREREGERGRERERERERAEKICKGLVPRVLLSYGKRLRVNERRGKGELREKGLEMEVCVCACVRVCVCVWSSTCAPTGMGPAVHLAWDWWTWRRSEARRVGNECRSR